MGLDVDVYCGLAIVESPVLDSDGNPENYESECKFYSNPDFPGRIDGIDVGAVYHYESVVEVFSGGYGRFGNWREKLAKMAGYPAVRFDFYGIAEFRCDQGATQAGAGPFFELINFSDCEGTIGPIATAKLARDFAEFQSAADGVDDDYFKSVYAKWRACCESAGDNGALSFR